MKWLSDRISFHRHDEYTTILISTKVEKWKEGLLFGWLLLWFLVGVSIFYIIFSGTYLKSIDTQTSSNQLQLFLILFLVFWGYYFYKIIKVYLWRRKGVEYFKLDKGSLVLKKAYGKVGRANSYLYENMGELKLIEISPRSFSSVMNGAFWDIGNESIQFEYYGKQVVFGRQLEIDEAKKLKKFINTEIKKYLNRK